MFVLSIEVGEFGTVPEPIIILSPASFMVVGVLTDFTGLIVDIFIDYFKLYHKIKAVKAFQKSQPQELKKNWFFLRFF